MCADSENTNEKERYTSAMAVIIPAILPTSREDLEHKLLLLHGITREVQIDSVESKPSGALMPIENPIEGLESFGFEIDLMVDNSPRAIEQWMSAGASRIVVHTEHVTDLRGLIQSFQTIYGHDKGFAPELLAFGLAINIEVDTATLEPYLDQCDFIQFMGLAHIGKQGEPFDVRVIPKIAAFHRAHPDMVIQVDGGVSLQSIPDLMNAGASRLIVGSGLWNAPDLGERMHELTQLAHTYS
jgi:ribulose-phosphate 3-epimerase